MSADLILYNGELYTMDERRPIAAAIAIRDNKILAVGDDVSMRNLVKLGGTSIDLQGKCVVPGLIDAHLHFEWYSLGLKNVDAETPTLDEVLRRVEERTQTTPPGAWIRGHGWNQTVWGSGAFPTKADLDRVAPNHPAFLTAKSGHAGWANSLALKLAGVGAATPDPPGGAILRDASGELSGILLEEAMNLVRKVIPEASAGEVADAMRDAIPLAHRAGLTGVHDFDGARAFQAWQILKERGELNLRVSKTIPVYLLDHAIALGLRSGFGDDRLRINGVKTFADGALGPRTALMIDPYDGEQPSGNRGIVVTDKEEMIEKVRKASAAGLSSTIHAIGDRANHDVLDVYEIVRGEERQRGDSRLRHRLEHVQVIHPDDYERLAQLNVIASMQPIHATSDMLMADKYWGKRSAGAYAWRTQLNAGARLAFGSDAPVETFDPLAGIHAAVTRRRADGSPGPDGWYPEQRLTVHEAVYAYTMGSAFAAYEETQKGSLTPGKLADLVIIDRDIFKIDPTDILHARVVGTIVDGRFIWRDPFFD